MCVCVSLCVDGVAISVGIPRCVSMVWPYQSESLAVCRWCGHIGRNPSRDHHAGGRRVARRCRLAALRRSVLSTVATASCQRLNRSISADTGAMTTGRRSTRAASCATPSSSRVTRLSSRRSVEVPFSALGGEQDGGGDAVGRSNRRRARAPRPGELSLTPPTLPSGSVPQAQQAECLCKGFAEPIADSLSSLTLSSPASSDAATVATNTHDPAAGDDEDEQDSRPLSSLLSDPPSAGSVVDSSLFSLSSPRFPLLSESLPPSPLPASVSATTITHPLSFPFRSPHPPCRSAASAGANPNRVVSGRRCRRRATLTRHRHGRL